MFDFIKRLLHKDKSSNPNDLFKFLDKADDAYMKALESKNLTYFQPYASLAVLRRLQNRMKAEEPYFGLARYRKRTWSIVSVTQELYTIEKNLSHDNIKVTTTVIIPLGEDVHELWTVEQVGGKFTVTDIRSE